MTFEDVEDLSPAAEFYMFSSQVDGEQDLLVPSPKTYSISPVLITNGLPRHSLSVSRTVAPNPSLVKTEPVVSQVVNRASSITQSSILARQLSLGQAGIVKPLAAADPSPDKMYSCDMCSPKLKNKRNFDTHMKRHRGELPFKCDECPKTFQGRRDLETHKRSRHDQARRTRTEHSFTGGAEATGPPDLSLIITRSSAGLTPASVSSSVAAIFSPAPAPEPVSTSVSGLSMNGLTSDFTTGKIAEAGVFRLPIF